MNEIKVTLDLVAGPWSERSYSSRSRFWGDSQNGNTAARVTRYGSGWELLVWAPMSDDAFLFDTAETEELAMAAADEALRKYVVELTEKRRKAYKEAIWQVLGDVDNGARDCRSDALVDALLGVRS